MWVVRIRSVLRCMRGPRTGGAKTVRDAVARNLQLPAGRSPGMALELEHDCPRCGEPRSFYRRASTMLHLGRKTKWACPECDYTFVRVDGIDSSERA